MSTLTRDEIAKAITEKLGLPKSQSTHLTETVIELIKSSLSAGEDVLISGFGKFSVKSKGERRGRNPATGDTMMLKSRKVVTFRYSETLKKRLNP